MDLHDLKAAYSAAVEKARAIRAGAEAAGEDLTDAQVEKIEALVVEAKEHKGQIEKLEAEAAEKARRLAALDDLGDLPAEKPKATAGRAVTQPAKVVDRREKDPMAGYRHEGDFYADVIRAEKSGHVSDNLRFLAAAGGDEQQTLSDPYGGFLVPEGVRAGLLTTSADMDPIGGRTTKIPMGSPSIKMNARVDKNHSSSVSGGLTVKRRVETQSTDSSRMTFEQITLSVNNLSGLVYISDELLADSPISIGAIVRAGAAEEFASKMVDERIDGTGVGMMLGVLNSPATVSVAKESGQAADTINATNVRKMRARAWNYQNRGYVWLVNHDAYVQLSQMHVAGTNSDSFIFVPGNGVDKPDTLLGKPVIFTEHVKTLGDKGDIILADWSQYLDGVYGGLETAESMHVRFVNHEQALRFNLRNDGRPWWTSVLTPKNSSSTLSPFVTLDERA